MFPPDQKTAPCLFRLQFASLNAYSVRLLGRHQPPSPFCRVGFFSCPGGFNFPVRIFTLKTSPFSGLTECFWSSHLRFSNALPPFNSPCGVFFADPLVPPVSIRALAIREFIGFPVIPPFGRFPKRLPFSLAVVTHLDSDLRVLAASPCTSICPAYPAHQRKAFSDCDRCLPFFTYLDLHSEVFFSHQVQDNAAGFGTFFRFSSFSPAHGPYCPPSLFPVACLFSFPLPWIILLVSSIFLWHLFFGCMAVCGPLSPICAGELFFGGGPITD